jgi:hypothetical protein
MIGPFKPALGGFRWVYVIIDKFSKWIEYKPLVSGTAKKVAELLNEIIHRIKYVLVPISRTSAMTEA